MVRPVSRDEAEGFPEVAVWNMVFLSHTREHWWDFFTPPAWRHVAAFGYANGRWITYDAADTRSVIMVLSPSQFDMWIALREPRITEIVRVPVAAGAGLRGRVGLWCVPAMKHLVGMRSSALRPKALCRDFIRAGYERVPYGRQSAES